MELWDTYARAVPRSYKRVITLFSTLWVPYCTIVWSDGDRPLGFSLRVLLDFLVAPFCSTLGSTQELLLALGFRVTPRGDQWVIMKWTSNSDTAYHTV